MCNKQQGEERTVQVREITWKCLFKDIVDHFCAELYEKLLKYLSRGITLSDVCFIRNFPINMLRID